MEEVQKITELMAKGGFSCAAPDLNLYKRVQDRKPVTLKLGELYNVFDPLRLALTKEQKHMPLTGGSSDQLIKMLMDHGLVSYSNGSQRFRMNGAEAKRYIDGVWLEEYTFHSAKDVGVETAVFGQKVFFSDPQTGLRKEREIDVVFQKDDELLLISNKCARTLFDSYGIDRTHFRKRMRKAVAEMRVFRDCLQDHVKVKLALVISSDLIDEIRGNRERHPELMDYVEQQGVHLIGLDHLAWESFIPALKNCFQP